jgi:SLOG-like protein
VELAIYTHLPYSGDRGKERLSRNHINVLSCDAIVALPGGAGTASEVSLAVQYRKPIIVFSSDEARVGHFSPDAPRAVTLNDVARFLDKHLRYPGDRPSFKT